MSDYFSRYLEILHLPATTSVQVIEKLKATFACDGIPEVLVSDNGPQLVLEEFRKFSEEYDFNHVTSNPHLAQSHGLAEMAVQVAKGIVRQKDPCWP